MYRFEYLWLLTQSRNHGLGKLTRANFLLTDLLVIDVIRMHTIFKRSQPRIVRLDGIPMDVLPKGFMLVTKSHDVPGVIAQVSSLLGKSDLNIAEYRLGREKPGGTAFSFINLDSEAPESVLVQLRGLPPMIEVKQVCL